MTTDYELYEYVGQNQPIINRNPRSCNSIRIFDNLYPLIGARNSSATSVIYMVQSPSYMNVVIDIITIGR